MPKVEMGDPKPTETPLRRLRLALGLTQLELGTQAGVTASRISQAELRGGPLGIDPTLKIAELYRSSMDRLGITTEDILRGRRGQMA